MNGKSLALYIRLENNLEIARTSRDTGKTPLMNYGIGNNNKKRKIFEKLQESLEYTGTLVTCSTIVTSEKVCELQI